MSAKSVNLNLLSERRRLRRVEQTAAKKAEKMTKSQQAVRTTSYLLLLSYLYLLIFYSITLYYVTFILLISLSNCLSSVIVYLV